jgi:ribosomal protein S18 acetylase RimI-like enzyme
VSNAVEYVLNKCSALKIVEHLSQCDASFMPPLSSRVVINDYAMKIANNAVRFEAWSDDTMVGLVAVYCNDEETGNAYITSVSVLESWTGNGIAACLINQCVKHATSSGMRQISLEVASDNMPAIRLYEKSGFVVKQVNAPFVTMNLYLKSRENYE